MRKAYAVGLVVLVVLASASVAVAATRNFSTHLTGSAERPTPVDTRAQGQAKLKLSKEGNELHYKLNVANINNVTQAHIHRGAAHEAGPVVAWLYPDGPPAVLIPGRSSGTLAEGTITDADLVGPLAGMTIDDLLALIESGNAYVNVHTTANPPGEIRGQID